MNQVLLVEDDLRICEGIMGYFADKKEADIQLTVINDGETALGLLYENVYDLVLLDIMLPGANGFEICKEIRKKNDTPIIFLTARGLEEDILYGYDLGCDDYMVKPVNINEMLLRVNALLRRAQMTNERRQVIGETVMECDSLTVTRGETSMILPQKEFMLLYKMAAYPGKIFTRQQLMDDIWGYDSDSDSHTVDVHIGRLRERFRDNPDFHIVTMRGVGYKVVKA